jgi:DNA-binding transcriptional LysR family regulator
MSEFDYLGLDGRALRVFLTVLETGSVTAAAEHLGTTQSAVSHTLEKLRGITGDALFVKAGRGIVATAHAQAMAEPARALLDGMRTLALGPRFDPASSRREFTIAANDYQRDLLLPPVLQAICAQAPGVRLRIVPAGIPNLEQLREGYCDLTISPEPPQGGEVLNEHLVADRLVCFYDPAHTEPPRTMEQYLAARHIGLRFDDSDRADFENRFRAVGIHRTVAVVVDNVASIPSFMRGTALLAIVPSMLDDGLMRGLAWVTPPFEVPTLEIHMTWHRRNETDAAHQWLRGLIRESAAALQRCLAAGGGLAQCAATVNT